MSNIFVDGKYRLTKKIGEGAYGEVFAARDLLGREEYAVKIVKYCFTYFM